MLKRLFLLLSVIVPLLATGQLATGQWQVHPTFVQATGYTQNVIDAGGPIYFLSSNFLYRFDRTTKEVTHLNTDNALSDASTIQLIAFNYDANYLMVVYQNTNIDIIKSDGRVVNMPGIYNAVMFGTKTINDVTFAGNRAYIATSYGMAVLEPAGSGFKFVENRIYNQNLSSVARVGNWRIAVVAADQGVYYAPESDNIESFDAFTRALAGDGFPANANATVYPINDTRFFVGSTNLLGRVELTDAGNGTLTFSLTQLYAQKPANIQRHPAGFLINCYANSRTYTTDANGETPKQLGTGKYMRTLYPTNPDGDTKNQPWVLGATGLYKNGTTTYYLPNGIDFAGQPHWALTDPFTGVTYIKPNGPNSVSAYTNTAIDAYDGSKWTTATPSWTVNGANKSLGSTYEMLFHPEVQGLYFLPCWNGSGLLRVRDGAVDFAYDATTSVLVRGTSNNARHPAVAFDSHYNLWAALGAGSEGTRPSVFMLPREKVLDTTSSKSDWYTMAQSSVDTYTGNTQNVKLAIAPQNDVKVFTDGDYTLHLVFWRSDNPTDTRPESRTITSLRDQTGNSLGKVTYIRTLVPDNVGNIWMGFTEGLVYFNAANAFTDDFRVTRPIIDGQPLLSGTQVNAIAFDADNCKWIGTNADGVYKVNADNTKILQHFTTSNSPLSTNKIHSVGCNRATGSVWITTETGVYEYKDDVIASAADYSNVTVYPSLVKPDFTGLVTVSGLMNASNVVFKNRAGEIVGQTVSTGGTATWDGCDATGNRLPTGTYTVHASQGDATATPAVARIRIVK